MSDKAVTRFLRQHYGELATEPRLLGAGEWSKAYAFALDGRAAVIRFGEHPEDFAKDEIMSRVSSKALPIPASIDRGTSPLGHFAVSVRAYGGYLDELDGAAMRQVLPALFAALDAIRRIDTSHTVGYGIWNPDCDAPFVSWKEALLAIGDAPENPRIAGWRARLASSPTGRGPFDAAFRRLKAIAPGMPSERHIIHSDLLNRNVLVDGTGITAVLDWGNAMYGDALYDVAWLMYWWPWFSAWSSIDIEAEFVRHLLAADAAPYQVRDRLLCYQLHIGLDAQAYNAFTGRWNALDRTARRTLGLITQSG